MRTSRTLSDLEMRATGPSASFSDRVQYGVAKATNYISNIKGKIDRKYAEFALRNEMKLALGEYSPYALISDIKDAAKEHPVATAGVAALPLVACDPCNPTPTPEPGPDTIKPETVLYGSNPYQTFVGDAYEEAGFSASDNVDGDITHKVVVTNDDDPARAGTYTFSYNVSDEAGNAADEKTRTVERSVESSQLENTLEMETRLVVGGKNLTVREAVEHLYSLGRISEMPARGTGPGNIEGDYSVAWTGTAYTGDTPTDLGSGTSDLSLSGQSGLSIDYAEYSSLTGNGAVVGNDGKMSFFVVSDYNGGGVGDWIDVIFDKNESSEKTRVRLVAKDIDMSFPFDYIVYNEAWAEQ